MKFFTKQTKIPVRVLKGREAEAWKTNHRSFKDPKNRKLDLDDWELLDDEVKFAL